MRRRRPAGQPFFRRVREADLAIRGPAPLYFRSRRIKLTFVVTAQVAMTRLSGRPEAVDEGLGGLREGVD
jgi:hypothetical protein